MPDIATGSEPMIADNGPVDDGVRAYALTLGHCTIKFEESASAVWILDIATDERYLRQGEAARALDALFTRAAGKTLVPGVFTEQGEHLQPLLRRLAEKHSVKLDTSDMRAVTESVTAASALASSLLEDEADAFDFDAPSPDVLPADVTTPQQALDYAWDKCLNAGMKGQPYRVPEAEHLIKQDAMSATAYCYDMTLAPWPEAEAVIARDPESASCYAINLLKRRWPEAEPVMQQNPEWWNRYCRQFGLPIPERAPRALPADVKTPDDAYAYARDLHLAAGTAVPFRCQEAEPLILKSAPNVYWYAVQRLRERWPEGEAVLRRDRHWWSAYCTRFGITESTEPDFDFSAPSAPVLPASVATPHDAYWYAFEQRLEHTGSNEAPYTCVEAEPMLMQDADMALLYVANIRKSRWPEAEPLLKSSSKLNWRDYCRAVGMQEHPSADPETDVLYPAWREYLALKRKAKEAARNGDEATAGDLHCQANTLWADALHKHAAYGPCGADGGVVVDGKFYADEAGDSLPSTHAVRESEEIPDLDADLTDVPAITTWHEVCASYGFTRLDIGEMQSYTLRGLAVSPDATVSLFHGDTLRVRAYNTGGDCEWYESIPEDRIDLLKDMLDAAIVFVRQQEAGEVNESEIPDLDADLTDTPPELSLQDICTSAGLAYDALQSIVTGTLIKYVWALNPNGYPDVVVIYRPGSIRVYAYPVRGEQQTIASLYPNELYLLPGAIDQAKSCIGMPVNESEDIPDLDFDLTALESWQSVCRNLGFHKLATVQREAYAYDGPGGTRMYVQKNTVSGVNLTVFAYPRYDAGQSHIQRIVDSRNPNELNRVIHQLARTVGVQLAEALEDNGDPQYLPSKELPDPVDPATLTVPDLDADPLECPKDWTDVCLEYGLSHASLANGLPRYRIPRSKYDFPSVSVAQVSKTLSHMVRIVRRGPRGGTKYYRFFNRGDIAGIRQALETNLDACGYTSWRYFKKGARPTLGESEEIPDLDVDLTDPPSEEPWVSVCKSEGLAAHYDKWVRSLYTAKRSANDVAREGFVSVLPNSESSLVVRGFLGPSVAFGVNVSKRALRELRRCIRAAKAAAKFDINESEEIPDLDVDALSNPPQYIGYTLLVSRHAMLWDYGCSKSNVLVPDEAIDTLKHMAAERWPGVEVQVGGKAMAPLGPDPEVLEQMDSWLKIAPSRVLGDGL